MVTVICTVAAPALVAIGVQALHKGTIQPEGALSLFCTAGGVVLWPTATALAADRLSHIDGLAHVLIDRLLALTFAFQFRLVRKLSGTWNVAARHLFYATLALIGLHAALWAFDSLTVPGDHEMLWYDHYDAQPVQW